jgi:hypothetical protein
VATVSGIDGGLVVCEVVPFRRRLPANACKCTQTRSRAV